jgi:hypothetical protein
MNDYARHYLRMRDSRRGRDGRNPYGSRGGYVDSRRGRDYNMDSMARGSRGGRDYGDYNYGNDMSRGRNDYAEYNRGQDSRDYAEHNMGRSSMDYEQSGQYNRDYADVEDGQYGNYRPVEAMGYFNGYYDMGSDYDMRDGASKLSSKDIKKWEKNLENADGTKGKKWDAEQIRQVAQQHGIRFEEYSPELLTAVANSLYSDYCKVLGADMMIYVKMAKAFLEDDDFDGEPEEKAMLYYKCIVSKDD